jgi:ubiquitin C-terminal hydrolase
MWLHGKSFQVETFFDMFLQSSRELDFFDFLGHEEVTETTCRSCGFKSTSEPTRVIIHTVSMPKKDETVVNVIENEFMIPKVIIGKCQAPGSTCNDGNSLELHHLPCVFNDPHFFMVSLRRFSVAPNGPKKNNSLVNIGNYGGVMTVDSGTYAPLAVIEHLGDALNSGHFQTYISRDEEWYRISDNQMPKISSDSDIMGGLIFIYRRNSLSPN